MTGKSFPLLLLLLTACGPDDVDDVDELEDRCDAGGLLCPCETASECAAPLGAEPLCIENLCTHVCTAIPCGDDVDGVTCGPMTSPDHRRVCMMPCEQEAAICPELAYATCTNVPPPTIPAGESPLVCAS